VDPTVKAPSDEDGDDRPASMLELPAATVGMTPNKEALRTASFKEVLMEFIPKDKTNTQLRSFTEQSVVLH
jgi:hypothetical protein